MMYLTITKYIIPNYIAIPIWLKSEDNDNDNDKSEYILNNTVTMKVTKSNKRS